MSVKSEGTLRGRGSGTARVLGILVCNEGCIHVQIRRRSGCVSPEVIAATPRRATVLDMDRYQWIVLFAAWLGWGFDIFDSLLFNYVAATCVPVLLGIPFGTPEAAAATLRWAGILTSLPLVGWAPGGIIFGRIADRLGRTRTLLLTMAMYSLGTAACALAPNMWALVLFRVVASLRSKPEQVS